LFICDVTVLAKDRKNVGLHAEAGMPEMRNVYKISGKNSEEKTCYPEI
jgi:hypothetical protein